MNTSIANTQWEDYQANGYVRLGKVVSDDQIRALQKRIDDIMMGTAPVDYTRLLMQLDSTTGEYSDAGEQSNGFKGATLAYRKIQELEIDPLFREYVEHPLFHDICSRVYGSIAPIACFRAMFMNKPAQRGTLLPWHQDAWVSLDRQPQITLWTALDPATIANGCVQIIPGSHRLGRVNPDHPSGFLNDSQVRELCRESETVYLELEVGEVVLLHNWLLHRSDRNSTDIPRRAFSVCYMDGRTVDEGGCAFTQLFTGSGGQS